jgi:hypothetical protein
MNVLYVTPNFPALNPFVFERRIMPFVFQTASKKSSPGDE